MKRFLVLLAAIALAISVAGPAAAGKVHPHTTDPNQYYWDGSGWVDSTCNASHTISVVFYQDAGYAGYHTRICSNTPNFCDVPLAHGNAVDCFQSQYTQFALNDNPSSLTWNNTAACMTVYSAAGYADDVPGGGHLRLPGGTGSYYRLVNTNLGNDTASSMKVVGADKC